MKWAGSALAQRFREMRVAYETQTSAIRHPLMQPAFLVSFIEYLNALSTDPDLFHVEWPWTTVG